jgi:hypothetical protein
MKKFKKHMIAAVHVAGVAIAFVPAAAVCFSLQHLINRYR